MQDSAFRRSREQRGVLFHWRNQKFAFFQTRKFSTNVKKAMKILFSLLFSHIFQNFCHFMHLCNIPKFGGLGGHVAPGFGIGTFDFGGLYNSLSSTYEYIHIISCVCSKIFKTCSGIKIYLLPFNIMWRKCFLLLYAHNRFTFDLAFHTCRINEL